MAYNYSLIYSKAKNIKIGYIRFKYRVYKYRFN